MTHQHYGVENCYRNERSKLVTKQCDVALTLYETFPLIISGQTTIIEVPYCTKYAASAIIHFYDCPGRISAALLGIT